MIKAGIIGTGKISDYHTRAYQKIPDVKVTACCGTNEEKTKAYAEKYGIAHWYTDYNKMLENEDLDVVSVTAYNSLHKDCSIAALRAGANVLCEKPMALNATEASEMKKASEEEHKLLQIGFMRRFGRDVAAFNDFRDAGIFGDIYYAKVAFLRRSGFPGGWFGDKSCSGGGPLIDLGVHFIDLARFLAGNPKPVSVFGVTYSNLGINRAKDALASWSAASASDHTYDVEDLASALIRFENGFTVSVEASFNLNCRSDYKEIKLYGTKGGIQLAPEYEIYTQLGDRFVNVTPAGSCSFDMTESFDAQIKSFVDASMRGGKCIAPADDGVVLMKIIDGIYRSAVTGHEVIL